MGYLPMCFKPVSPVKYSLCLLACVFSGTAYPMKYAHGLLAHVFFATASAVKYAHGLLAHVFFCDSQEVLIMVTELTVNCHTARFISHFDCKEYFALNKELLFYERQKDLILEVQRLGLDGEVPVGQ